MRMVARLLLSVLIISSLFTACQKELSYEQDGSIIVGGGTSEGIIDGNTGPCTNTDEAGLIAVGVKLADTNRIYVQINFTQAGTYTVTSDTINGIHFSGSGSIPSTGVSQISLRGFGTPLGPGKFNFTVSYKGSYCSFPITVYTIAPASGTDYFPTLANAYWRYKSSSPNARPVDTVLTTSRGSQVVIAGNNYNVFSSEASFGKDSSYYRKATGEYHQYGDMDVAGIASTVVPGDYIFLKDNVDIGTVWEGPEGNASVNSVSVKLKLKMTLKEKNITTLVGNLIFKNVMVVTTEEQVQLPTGWTTAFTYDSWYAQGIGLINISAPAPVYGFYVTDYKIP